MRPAGTERLIWLNALHITLVKYGVFLTCDMATLFLATVFGIYNQLLSL